MSQAMATTTLDLREVSDIPHFFFSYARADRDKYLERFFSDLTERVAGLLATGTNDVAFLDISSIETGEDWNTKIARAAQTSYVLVCIYSPRFFSKRRTNEFCAKEFSVFLERHKHNDELRYGPYKWGNETLVGVQGVRNIVPVLWYSESDLQKSDDLPPPMVRTVQYNLKKVNLDLDKLYRTKGMSRIAIRRSGTYFDVILRLAGLICEYSHNPLPPLPFLPDFTKLQNAFWDSPLEAPLDTGDSGIGLGPPDVAEADLAAEPSDKARAKEFQGPGQLLAIELRSPADPDSVWAPYPGYQSLSDLVADIATERRLACRSELLDPADSGFPSRLQVILTAATRTNTLAVLILDPFCLAEREIRDQLSRLIVQDTWRGGFLIPVDSSNEEALRLTAQHEHIFEISSEHEQQVVVRRAAGSGSDFRIALLSVLDGILDRIFKHGEIYQAFRDNAGPVTKPQITNVHTREHSYDRS
jgi:TIR domain